MTKTEQLAKWCDVMAAPPHSASKAEKFQQTASELRRLAAVEQELAACKSRCNAAVGQADALRQELADLKKLSVTNILLDITPGDGSGFEVYAKSVKDVEDMLTKLGTELEDFQLGIKKPFEVEKKLQELADLKAAMGEPSHIKSKKQTAHELDAMKKYIEKITKDKDSAVGFLTRAGIIDGSGELAEQYRNIESKAKP